MVVAAFCCIAEMQLENHGRLFSHRVVLFPFLFNLFALFLKLNQQRDFGNP